jgi:hypothetical protein
MMTDPIIGDLSLEAGKVNDSNKNRIFSRDSYIRAGTARDGLALSAASTGGEAIGDATVRRCRGAPRSKRCANPAKRWRAASKTVDLRGGVGGASRCA